MAAASDKRGTYHTGCLIRCVEVHEVTLTAAKLGAFRTDRDFIRLKLSLFEARWLSVRSDDSARLAYHL